MKKLLSILASVAVAGSSASAVVACSVNPTTNNNQPDGDITGDGPSVITGNGSNSGKSSLDPSTNIPTNGGSSNSGANDNGPVLSPQQQAINASLEKAKIEDNAQLVARKNILEDQFGIDGNYINKQLFNGTNPEVGHNVSAEGLNTKGTYGSAADKFPLLSFLHQSGVLSDSLYNTIANTVMPMLSGLNAPSPSALGSTISSLAPVLPMLKGVIGGAIKDPASIEKTVDGYLTPSLKKILLALTTNDNTLDSSFDKITYGDSLNSIMMGAAYIVGTGFGDADKVSKFSDLTKVDNANDAITYLTTQLIAILGAKDGEAPSFNLDNFSSQTSINVITNTIKLLALYMEQYNQYKFSDSSANQPDKNHIFNDVDKNGNLKTTFQAVQDVKNAKIKTEGWDFNILKFIQNISYYLGKLDTQQGIFRLQAVFAMFFTDDVDRTSVSKLFLSWDNNYSSAGLSQEQGGESKNMSPIMKFIDKFIYSYMINNKPDAYQQIIDKIKNVSVLGLHPLSGLADQLKWPVVVEIARHNIYMVVQSITWNKGFGMSNEKLAGLVPMSAIDDGLDSMGITGQAIKLLVDFSGLNVMPQWSQLESQGILNYLFTGNVYELLNEAQTNDKMVAFYKSLDTFKDGLSKTINDGIGEALTLMKPYASEVPLNAKINLNGNLSDYTKIEFKSNGVKSVLNTNLNASKPKSGNWINYGRTYPGAYPDPSIEKVVAGSYDRVNNKTKLYIYAKNIYNGNGHYPKDFASTLYLNGQSIGSDVSTGDFDNSSYNVAVTYTATVSGKVTSDMNVSGDAWDCTGDNGSDDFFGVHHAKWMYDHKKVENDVINVPWENDDPLNMNSIMKLDFGGDSWKNVNSINLSMADIQNLPDLQITGYNDKNPSGISIRGTTESKDGPSINLQSVAAWSLSSLLGVVGLAPFSAQKSPLGLPVADDNTVGQLILKIGNLLDEDVNGKKIADLSSFNNDLNPQNFQHLIYAIFGKKDGDKNVVDKVLDGLVNGDMAELNDALGLTSSANQYDKNGLIGALIYAFTPKAIGGIDSGDAGDTIYGDNKDDSPLWNYLLANSDDPTKQGLLMRAWSMVNDNDNKLELNKLNADSNFNFDWVYDDKKKDGTFTKATVNINYKFSWISYNSDGTTTTKYNGKLDKDGKNLGVNYTLEITNADTNPTYTITKVTND